MQFYLIWLCSGKHIQNVFKNKAPVYCSSQWWFLLGVWSCLLLFCCHFKKLLEPSSFCWWLELVKNWGILFHLSVLINEVVLSVLVKNCYNLFLPFWFLNLQVWQQFAAKKFNGPADALNIALAFISAKKHLDGIC